MTRNITFSADKNLIEAARERARGAHDAERAVPPLTRNLCPTEEAA
jgi:hypothetical protein